MMTSQGDRPPSDPLLRALGAFEHQEADRVAKIEAAVDRGDVAELSKLLGTTREAAEEMITRLASPDQAQREAWLDRWEGARKTRRLFPRVIAGSGLGVAAAAAATILFWPQAKPMFVIDGAQIVSRPADHLSGDVEPVVIEPTIERHRQVSGDLLKVTVTSAGPQDALLDAMACWKAGEKIELWTVPGAVERDDDRHSTIGVKIPDDARGEGRLYLVVARKGDLPDERAAREACADPQVDQPWRVVEISPPILVEPNVSRKEKLSP